MEQNTTAKQNIFTLGWFVSLFTITVGALTLYVGALEKIFGVSGWSKPLEDSSPSVLAIEPTSTDNRLFMVFIIIFSIIFAAITVITLRKPEAETIAEMKNNQLRVFVSHILLWSSALFIFGVIFSLLYKLLGAEVLKGEIAQELLILLLSAVIFGYEFLASGTRAEKFGWKKLTTIFSSFILLFSLLSVVVSFSVVGSPVETMKKDNDKKTVLNVYNLHTDVIYYFEDKQKLPTNLEDTKNPYLYSDSLDYSKYTYRVVNEPVFTENSEYSDGSFEICANFETKDSSRTKPQTKDYKTEEQFWNHEKGNKCFVFVFKSADHPVYNYKNSMDTNVQDDKAPNAWYTDESVWE